MVKYGYREVKWDERKSQNKITWYEEIQEGMRQRDIRLINKRVQDMKITANEMIIEIAKRFIVENKISKSGYNEINHVQL